MKNLLIILSLTLMSTAAFAKRDSKGPSLNSSSDSMYSYSWDTCRHCVKTKPNGRTSWVKHSLCKKELKPKCE